MMTDRGEVAAARIRSTRQRIGQLQERIERLSAGLPSTRHDVAVARTCAENQRAEALRAQERLFLTYAAAADVHRPRSANRDRAGRAAEAVGEQRSTGRTPHPTAGSVGQVLTNSPHAVPDLDRWRPAAEDRIIERLSRENRLLRSSLVAMATSVGGEGSGVWGKDRRRQVWQAVVDQCGDESWQGWARALCLAATATLPTLRGAAVSGYDDHRVPHLLAVTDEWTRQAEGIHQLVGEGPAVEAYTSQSVVVVRNLADQQARWPGFVAAAVGTGLSCLCALPVRLDGVTLGSISLYFRAEGGPGWQEWLDGAFLASAAAKALLVDLDAIEDGLYFGDPEDERIQVATGMLVVQLNLSVDEALARMRAFAFSNARGLSEVAEAIVDGSLRLP